MIAVQTSVVQTKIMDVLKIDIRCGELGSMGVPPLCISPAKKDRGETSMLPQCPAVLPRRRANNPNAPNPTSDNVVGSGTINPATPPDS